MFSEYHVCVYNQFTYLFMAIVLHNFCDLNICLCDDSCKVLYMYNYMCIHEMVI